VFNSKPIIGISGGIGSGKSMVAGIFRELGCMVISSDEQVREAYKDQRIVRQLREWWGESVLDEQGELNRKKVADIIFGDPSQRLRLETLLHPAVAVLRQKRMEVGGEDPQVTAFVWDTPLLFEAGLRGGCDAIVFVEAPLERRLERVKASRGWTEAELHRREKSQWPLDKKREISDYIVVNTADAEYVRGQVREVLFRILAKRLPDQT
jgi:dephospho-CoA kinase